MLSQDALIKLEHDFIQNMSKQVTRESSFVLIRVNLLTVLCIIYQDQLRKKCHFYDKVGHKSSPGHLTQHVIMKLCCLVFN